MHQEPERRDLSPLTLVSLHTTELCRMLCLQTWLHGTMRA